MREKEFRSDLYYRLNVVTLRLPPLRARVEDVPQLAMHFLVQFARENRLKVEQVAPSAMEALRRYEWPGNVRELQNVIEYAATLAAGSTIEVSDLPESLQGGEGFAVPVVAVEQGGLLFEQKKGLMENFERDYLIGLLVDHRFNISRAAEAAGCHRRTLYRMIMRHRLDLAALRRQHGGRRRSGEQGAPDPA